MAGSSTASAPGVYGVLGWPVNANVPGSREEAIGWKDKNGNLWLLGGSGLDANGNEGLLNDLWVFRPSLGQWTWMGGSSMVGANGGQHGVYGTLQTPAVGNVPGSRMESVPWRDSTGNLWLFGGSGVDSAGNNGDLNDLWEYQPPASSTATPTFSVAAGTYTSIQTVSISDTTTGASIYYTTDGSTPTASSTLYSSTITVANTETLQAIAVAVSYNNSAVASAAYIINIPPDFSVAATPTALSVSAGSSGTATVSVTPQGGFASAVSFACSGLPSGASCSFLPATVTPSGTAASTTTLTVTTAAASAAIPRNSFPFLPGSALAVAFCCLGWKKRRRLQSLLLLAVGGAGLSLLGACGLFNILFFVRIGTLSLEESDGWRESIRHVFGLVWPGGRAKDAVERRSLDVFFASPQRFPFLPIHPSISTLHPLSKPFVRNAAHVMDDRSYLRNRAKWLGKRGGPWKRSSVSRK